MKPFLLLFFISCTALAQDSTVTRSDYDTSVLCVFKYFKNNTPYKYYEKKGAVLHGKTYDYYPNSFIRYHRNYWNGVLHGMQCSFTDEGTLVKTETYTKGTLNGRQCTYSNGYLVTDINYSNGVLSGESRTNYPTSSFPQQIIQYANGKKNGEGKYYYAGNFIMTEYTYANDNLQGISRTFYDNGMVQSVGSYVNNEEEGEWNYFTTDGAHEKTVVYKHI